MCVGNGKAIDIASGSGEYIIFSNKPGVTGTPFENLTVAASHRKRSNPESPISISIKITSNSIIVDKFYNGGNDWKNKFFLILKLFCI